MQRPLSAPVFESTLDVDQLTDKDGVEKLSFLHARDIILDQAANHSFIITITSRPTSDGGCSDRSDESCCGGVVDGKDIDWNGWEREVSVLMNPCQSFLLPREGEGRNDRTSKS